MDDDELRRQLSHAAAEFPLRGRSLDLHRRVTRRRRIAAGFAVTAGVMAAAGIAVAAPLVTDGAARPDPATPPAQVANAEYIGSTWRLTLVTDGAKSTVIPADLDARMTLAPDGQFLIHDGVNFASGKYTRFADGFELRDVAMTAVGYIGKDPHQLAAMAGFGAVVASSRDDSPSSRRRNLVRSVDQTQLVLQAGKLRLTFQRTVGAATTTPDTVPASVTPD